MTDVDQAGTEGTAPHASNIQSIPVTKVKGLHLDIDFDAIPLDVYREMLFLGAKEYINSVGMSKIGAGLTKLEGTELDKAHEAVKTQAEKNVEAINTGNGFKFHGTKSETKVSGAVNTEAMRLAKNLVKDAMKKAGLKISHTPASEITAAAKEVLRVTPDLIKTAEANLKARAETPIKGLDITKLIKADPALVAKADAAKAAKKKSAPLSAKQAGMVAPKQKPSQATAH